MSIETRLAGVERSAARRFATRASREEARWSECFEAALADYPSEGIEWVLAEIKAGRSRSPRMLIWHANVVLAAAEMFRQRTRGGDFLDLPPGARLKDRRSEDGAK